MTTTQFLFAAIGVLIAYILLTPNGGGIMSTAGQPYEDIIMKWATTNLPNGWNVSDFYNLIRAVITHESNWQPSIVGVTGDIGLMQINPVNMPAFGLTDQSQLFDPDTNIWVGTSILKEDIDRYGLNDGLAAYNGGPSNRKIEVTQRYAQTVLAIYNQYQTTA